MHAAPNSPTTQHCALPLTEEWLPSFGCDGSNIMFPYLPAGVDDVVDKVIPELQRRGVFRREYEGKTLRENLGLPRPKNRFFEG